MEQDRSFNDMMVRLREGDETAAAEVFHRFARQLIGLARGWLDEKLRQKIDPEDVLQSVFRSFFLRNAAGDFDLKSWDSLWSMLTVITVRKCCQHAKHYRAARRNVRREINPPPDNSDRAWEALDRDPIPLEAATLAETVEDLMRGLDASERPILILSLQGKKVSEISEESDRTQRTVQRVLRRIRQRLERMCVEGENRDQAAPRCVAPLP